MFSFQSACRLTYLNDDMVHFLTNPDPVVTTGKEDWKNDKVMSYAQGDPGKLTPFCYYATARALRPVAQLADRERVKAMVEQCKRTESVLFYAEYLNWNEIEKDRQLLP